MDFIEKSNRRHSLEFKNCLEDEQRIKVSMTWFREDTADYWRHIRMYECADCLPRNHDATWLTVGDGRWGLDAIRLGRKGVTNVLPTDLSEYLLREAQKRGYIKEYRIENAESLRFADGSFDYVFCKEAYHHFPRPALALYEMLRVARKAVFLIEPNDKFPEMHRVQAYCQAVQAGEQAIFPNPDRCDYEGSGNYVFSISRRELEKVALGLDYPHLVYKGLNDHYVKGCEFEPADREASAVFREIEDDVARHDAQCRLGVADYDLLMAGIFKTPLDDATREAFMAHGWTVMDLPRNPHIGDSCGEIEKG